MHRVYDPSIPTEEQGKGQLDDTGLVNLANSSYVSLFKKMTKQP